MANDRDGWIVGRILGDCPGCERPIPKGHLLAAYRGEGEWPRMLAECPRCTAVVRPM